MRLIQYRYWFYAAAAYNFVWGAVNIFFPHTFFTLADIPSPVPIPIWQVVGMMVLAYAPAYFWAARHPDRYAHMILIGFLGKVMGPIGFVWSWATGQLPAAFGWTILTNDLIWLPAFALYLRHAAIDRGGIAGLLSGDWP